MSDPVLFVAAALAQGPFASKTAVTEPPPSTLPTTQLDPQRSRLFDPRLQANTYPEPAIPLPQLSPFQLDSLQLGSLQLGSLELGDRPAFDQRDQLPLILKKRTVPAIAPLAARPLVNPPVAAAPGPRSNTELYYQRQAALYAGKLYTRQPIHSFAAAWQGATQKPTYRQWRRLLAAEARAVTRGQGNNRLAILVGDSLSLWYPSDRLPQNQLWLNQSISGETTRGILNRLADFAPPRAHTIYLLAGVNDLKQGFSDAEILGNLRTIMLRLRYYHPQAQIVVQSILPTQSPLISNARIVGLNRQLAAIAQQSGVNFLNLHPQFADAKAHLRPELTTDGIHLTALGYATWQNALQQTTWVARR